VSEKAFNALKEILKDSKPLNARELMLRLEERDIKISRHIFYSVIKHKAFKAQKTFYTNLTRGEKSFNLYSLSE